jgi:hypothetical protein
MDIEKRDNNKKWNKGKGTQNNANIKYVLA